MCLNEGRGEDSSKSTALYVFLVPSPDINIYKTLYFCSLLVFFSVFIFLLGGSLHFALHCAPFKLFSNTNNSTRCQCFTSHFNTNHLAVLQSLNTRVCVWRVCMFLRYFEQQIKQKYKTIVVVVVSFNNYYYIGFAFSTKFTQATRYPLSVLQQDE